MTGQLDLFQGVKLAEPEPKTTVRLGRKAAQIPLRKKQRAAVSVSWKYSKNWRVKTFSLAHTVPAVAIFGSIT